MQRTWLSVRILLLFLSLCEPWHVDVCSSTAWVNTYLPCYSAAVIEHRSLRRITVADVTVIKPITISDDISANRRCLAAVGFEAACKTDENDRECYFRRCNDAQRGDRYPYA